MVSPIAALNVLCEPVGHDSVILYVLHLTTLYDKHYTKRNAGHHITMPMLADLYNTYIDLAPLVRFRLDTVCIINLSIVLCPMQRIALDRYKTT